MKRTWITLGGYLDSVCMILGPWQISRGTVIRYVANKLGGRHYDTNRHEESTKIREQIFSVLDYYFDFYGDNPQPQNLQMFYGAYGNGLHAVVLGMCQDFEESPHISWFIDTLDSFLKSPPALGFK